MKEGKALEALKFIIPILKKYKFNWIITGGFACYVYGVDRPITDIDIDIEISKEDEDFNLFIKDVEPYVSQKLTHFKNEFYDNYNVELNYNNQVIDICPSKELKVYYKESGKYENIYNLFGGFPLSNVFKFNGLNLPLLPKKLIIINKEMIIRDKWDIRDIKGLKRT